MPPDPRPPPPSFINANDFLLVSGFIPSRATIHSTETTALLPSCRLNLHAEKKGQQRSRGGIKRQENEENSVCLPLPQSGARTGRTEAADVKYSGKEASFIAPVYVRPFV